jgi:hypothetical protein
MQEKITVLCGIQSYTHITMIRAKNIIGGIPVVIVTFHLAIRSRQTFGILQNI